jgi:transglutaminase-like putative cysteine protease
MKFKLLIIILFLFTGIASAQENIYDAGTIPKELMPYASAVVRNAQEAVEVKDLDNTVYYVKKIITVLNKNGDKAADIWLEHNKLISIKNAKGIVYNAYGAPLFKFSEKDFKEPYSGEDFSLYEDSHVEYYMPPVTEYPYTIEYEYEVRFKQTLVLPTWEPNPGTGIAVENSKYSISCKPDFNLRYKEINMPSSVSITTGKDGIKTYEWQINSLKAIREEAFKPVARNYLSEVEVAPERFEYDGVTGNFTNWNELGKFVNDKLLVDRQIVSPETVYRIKDLVAGITDPKLKAKKIYEYMQGRTRYVSIQVGIGSFQPFSAQDVDNLKYGDCKALVNYTQALLKIAGVDSYFCLVTGNHQKKISPIPDFASMDQFNHAILCLPFKNDTTWCDCTSQEIPFGYLGDFTDDRLALACTPEGGKIMHTTKYPAGDNIIAHKAEITINTDGSIAGTVNATFKGAEYDDRDEIIDEAQTERIKDLQHLYPVNNLHIEKLSFDQDKSLQPVTTEHMDIEAPEYASITDGKMYFLPAVTTRIINILPQVHNRSTDMYINEGFIEDDEITFTLPAGYHLESEHLNVNIEKQFGAYRETSTVKDGKLVYHRIFKLINGTYSKETYQELAEFYSDVYDHDGHNLTLVKD